jgi:protein tyrosine phosphatase type 4A
MRFVIMDAPRQTNLHLYVKELSKYHVHDIVRVCEPTYHADSLHNAGIGLHDMEYHDGHSPPNDVLERWCQLVEQTFYNNNNKKKSHTTTNTIEDEEDLPPALAVHCVAGLGRAPVLVAIALMEFAHMDPVEAVTLIRRHRRGAINEKQLIYLEGYKRHYKRKLTTSHSKKNNSDSGSTGCNCIIM